MSHRLSPVLIGGIVAVAFTQIVSAADLPRKAPAAPPPPPVFRWTGCYVGGNVGGIINNSSIDTRPSGLYELGNTAAQLAEVTQSYDYNNAGFTGGVQIGCNWQTQNWVLGGETDFNWSNLDRTINTVYGPTVTWLRRTETVNHGLDWYSTLRGRVGYAWGPTMAYVTGGLAFGRVSSDFSSLFADGTQILGSLSKRKTGWTAGGGVEHAFTANWSAKIEYLYIDLGSFTYNAVVVPAPVFTWTQDVDTRAHVVRAGLNYKFTN